MKKIICGLGLMLLAAGAAAQASDGGEQALRQALLQKQFFLRGFSADSTTRWKWDGKGLVRDEPQYFTVGTLKVNSVKVKGDHVVIQGNRRTLVRREGTSFLLSSVATSVAIDVDLRGAKMDEVLPLLPNILFFQDVNAALAQLPRAYTGMIPSQTMGRQIDVAGDRTTGRTSYSIVSPMTKVSDCDCGHPELCREDVPLIAMQGIVPAREKDPASAELPAGRADLNGSVDPAVVVVALDETGRVKYTWLGRPSDAELDEIELRAAKETTFVPATCHGKPVSSVREVFIPFMPPPGGTGSRGRK